MVFNGRIAKEAPMSRKDLLLVAGTAAVTSLLTYLTVSTLTTAPQTVSCEGGAACGTPSEVRAPDLAAREGARDRPRTDVEAPRPNLSKPTTAEVHSRTATPADAALLLQKQRELRERFSNPKLTNASIESRFYAEEWNPEWAGSTERGIRTLFASHEDLSAIDPQRVTCRSKNCQVVLSATNQEQVRLVAEKFMRAAVQSDVGMKDKIVSFFPDAASGSVVFYLSENGNADLFQ